MKQNPKIRLTGSIVMSILTDYRSYSATSTENMVLTPILYKVGWYTANGIEYKYQKRIAVRISPSMITYLRFRGKAPIQRASTLEEFCKSFYMIKDKKTGTPYFKYYRK